MKEFALHSPDCKRLGFVPIFAHSDALRAASVADAARCFGIFGSGDKVQSTTNTQIGASEDAQLATSQSVVAKDNSVSLGGNNTTNQIGGVRIGGNSSGAITFGYDSNTVQKILQTESDNLTSALSQQSSSNNSTVDKILSSVGALAQNSQTGGDASRNKIVLYVVLGVLAFLGWQTYRKSA